MSIIPELKRCGFLRIPGLFSTSPLENWPGSHRLAFVLFLVLLAILMRTIYFVQLDAGPCVWQHRWDQTDMHFWDFWAREIATGDWLSNQSLHPFHIWHEDVGKEYFTANPLAIRTYTSGNGQAFCPPERLLWQDWYGQKTFHQEPLYAYLIAATYILSSDDVRYVFVWQMGLGILNILLLLRITRRYFGVMVAGVAGLLATLCGPMMCCEMILDRSTLITFMGLLLLNMVDSAVRRPTGWRWLGAGMAFGIAILVKSTFALFWLGVVAGLFFSLRKSFHVLLKAVAGLVIGLLLALSPALIRNVLVEAPIFSLSSVGPITFLNSNAEDFSPETGFFVSQHAARIMGKSKGRFLATAQETLRTHRDISGYISLLWKKFVLIWHWYEIPNNSNYYYYRMQAPILYFTVTFTVLAPFSLLGLFLASWEWKRRWLLGVYIGCCLFTLLVFYVIARLRIELMVILIPFAAYAIVCLVGLAKQKHCKQLAVAIAAVALISLWTTRPLSNPAMLIWPTDYLAAYQIYYNPEMKKTAQSGNWQRVVEILRHSLRVEPTSVRNMAWQRQRAKTPQDAFLARLFSGVHRSYGAALSHLGETQAASVEAQLAATLLWASKANPNIDRRD